MILTSFAQISYVHYIISVFVEEIIGLSVAIFSIKGTLLHILTIFHFLYFSEWNSNARFRLRNATVISFLTFLLGKKFADLQDIGTANSSELRHKARHSCERNKHHIWDICGPKNIRICWMITMHRYSPQSSPLKSSLQKNQREFYFRRFRNGWKRCIHDSTENTDIDEIRCNGCYFAGIAYLSA